MKGGEEERSKVGVSDKEGEPMSRHWIGRKSQWKDPTCQRSPSYQVSSQSTSWSLQTCLFGPLARQQWASHYKLFQNKSIKYKGRGDRHLLRRELCLILRMSRCPREPTISARVHSTSPIKSCSISKEKREENRSKVQRNQEEKSETRDELAISFDFQSSMSTTTNLRSWVLSK